MAFEKELNILRNDFYYQMMDSSTTSLVDFLYRPLDVLSGDAYSVRRINENQTFYLLVDAMGKGVSASFTTVIITTFINHIIDKMIESDSFSLDILIRESMEFIQPVLLDDEVLAIDYICFDTYSEILEYAKFAMPPFLLHDKQDEIIKIKSNNPSLCKWQTEYKLDRYNISNIEKFLFYSDGVVENATDGEGIPYAAHIEEDFRNSFTKEEFREIKNHTEVPPVKFVEPTQDGPKRVILYKESQVEMLAIAFHIPNFQSPDQVALSVLSEILYSGKSSRLYQDLIQKKQLANQIYAYNMENSDPGLFIFLAVCNPGVKAEDVEKEIIAQIEKIKKDGVTQKELDKVKINTKADFIYSLESSSSVANLFGSYLVRGDIEPLLHYEERINAITADTVQKVAQKYFDFDHSTTVILRSKPKEEAKK
ncbi:Putative zinc protease [hydrothermal vent metagenome]|uniref:Putative zinc protease n=1 Tax=hydrothermal vent metagenome TaxID=652676 RepID=A0A1W1BP93_9ZZZZ